MVAVIVDLLICGGGQFELNISMSQFLNYLNTSNSGPKVGHRATFGGVLMRWSFNRLYSFEKKFAKQKPTPSFSENYERSMAI